ncbi:hypothetical protein EFY79_19755 [Hanamia caeni]|uniref:NACHT domain-containing protein n=1 Tax=Hanamia caeni TaxID=2294116 RepID=A0A3M9N504_9BACT|nr:hypothetical protein [Hanamia caeni]RNI32829.1 hypothetical protein EFY79_19755 [Hanamia caeni]
MQEMLSELYSWFVNGANVFIKTITPPIIVVSLYKIGKFVIEKVKAKRIEKSLFPYYTVGFIQQAKKKYIRTKCQNIDPANEINLKQSFAFAAREDLLKFFMAKVFKVVENENRFYLILADSGMGKTTFMVNLYMRFTALNYVNIFKKKIKLFPLGENFETLVKNIKSIENPHETILLLDGFDELPAIDNSEIISKFNELIESAKEFSIVIITCRTHFFSSEVEEPFELKIKKFNTQGNGFHTIKKIYISPFDNNDIKRYIKKTFPFYDFSNKRKALDVVNKTNDLMARPMLLSYIKDIITLSEIRLTTNFDIYESLIYNWIERESNKYPQDQRWDFKLNLIYFSYAASDFIYNNYEKNGLYIPLEVAQRISKEYSLILNDIEIKSRSLLNRNSGGDYKFSHKSIYEFFLAYNGYSERIVNGNENTIKYNLENNDFAKKLIEDIIISKRHKFLLPKMYDKFNNLNTDLYKKILDVRNKDIEVNWISGNKFKIMKTKSSNTSESRLLENI